MKLSPRTVLPGFALLTALWTCSCSHIPLLGERESDKEPSSFAAVTPLPSRDESVSFHGPGSSKVERGQFPPIQFATDSFLLPAEAEATLDQVAAHLGATGSSAILAGFTSPDEEYRVLGEQRALAVRQGLIERGANPALLQTVSYGNDLPEATDDPGRVEFGIVRTIQGDPIPIAQTVHPAP